LHKLCTWQYQQLLQHIPSQIVQLSHRKDELTRQVQAMHTEQVADPRRWYMQACHAVLHHMHMHLSGRLALKQSVVLPAARLHQACAAFKSAIHEGAWAQMRVIHEGGAVLVQAARGNLVAGEVVHVDDAFCCVDYVQEADRTSDVLFEQVNQTLSHIQSPQHEDWEENDVWSDGTKVYIGRSQHSFDTLRKIPLHKVRPDPSWLKEQMTAHRTEDLACFLNIDVFKSLVSDFIDKDWKPPCKVLLDTTRAIVDEVVHTAVQDTWSTSHERYPQMQSLVSRICRQAALDLWMQAQEQVEAQLLVEQHPYTQDDTLMADLAVLRQEQLQRDLHTALRLDQEGVVYDTQALQTILSSVFNKHQHKPVEDQLAEEMELVLDSYGKVATRRILDRIPMICWQVFRSLHNKVQDALWNVPESSINDCMVESSDFQQKFDTLKKELEDVSKALAILESIA
jgi:Dynamin GTPase effector domain